MTAQMQIPIPIHNAINPAAGNRAKAAGIAQAHANTPTSWRTACDAAIELMARRGVVFQAADLIKEGLVDEPDHPNRWGPRFAAAARNGVIQPAGYASSKRRTVRSSACKQWIGVQDKQLGSAA